MISLGNTPTRPQVWKVSQKKKLEAKAKILSTKLCCLAQRKAEEKQEENVEKRKVKNAKKRTKKQRNKAKEAP